MSDASPPYRSPDELALLVRSYADQAARRFDGTVVTVTPYDDNGVAWADVSFEGPAAGDARSAAAALLDGDPSLTAAEEWEDGAKLCIGVVDFPAAEWHADDYIDDRPPPEDDELATQLDMLEGPIEVTIPGFPPCVPTAKTRVVVVGLNLEGKGWTGAAYWDGEFPDLERARYWALKREREHKSKGYRASASAYWQHPASKDEMVAKVLESMNAR